MYEVLGKPEDFGDISGFSELHAGNFLFVFGFFAFRTLNSEIDDVGEVVADFV